MPRRAKELTALEVKRLKHPGHGRNHTVAVGGVSGLLLQITPNSGKSWLLRISVGNKRREFGLGSYPEIALGTARDRARELKGKVREGIDPIVERKAKQSALIAEQRRGLTFELAVEKYLAAKLDQFSNPKHRQQWRNTLRSYALPELGDMLVNDITVRDVLRALNPIWYTKTETASRVRGRIEAVLSWATVSGHREGDNPARWVGNLSELLPAPSKIKEEVHYPALQIDDVQRWIILLREMGGIARYALEFALLTALRSQAIRFATWDEINFATATWIVPAGHMKKKKEHRVPLSTGALALLETVPRFEGSNLIFTAPRGGRLSDMTLSAAMKRLHNAELSKTGTGFVDQASGSPAVPHGLRSTFRDWIAERTHFAGDIAEMALAHSIGNEAEAAYRRQQMVEKRRPMMQAWSDFVNGQQTDGIVIPFVGLEG